MSTSPTSAAVAAPPLSVSNGKLALTLDSQRAGTLTSLRSLASGWELAGAEGLQTWVKTAPDIDPNTGVYSLFLGKWSQRPMPGFFGEDLWGRYLEVELTEGGLLLRKRWTLHHSHPVVRLSLLLENHAHAPLEAQFECFFHWRSEPGSTRAATVIAGGAETHRLELPPYGSIFGSAYDARNAFLALTPSGAELSVVLQPRQGWQKFAILQQGREVYRGPYSFARQLAAGQSLAAELEFTILEGAAAPPDRMGSDGWTGIWPAEQLLFSDHSLRLAVMAARGPAALPKAVTCRLHAGGAVHGQQELTVNLKAGEFMGGMKELRWPGMLAAGAGQITAQWPDGGKSQAAVQVLDATPAMGSAAGQLIRPAEKPAIARRLLHLILSQQSPEGLSIDDLSWLLDELVVPAGFTGVIWEFNRALRLRSCPELAEPWSYSPQQVRQLVQRGKALGLEVIAQQNLYGHQGETNLVKAHPEMAEVPGEMDVYCPTQPRLRKLVSQIVGELLDIFEPHFFHMGHDEIQFRKRAQRIGVCPRCRQFGQPHEVFAHDVKEIHRQLAAAGVRGILWGDLLIPEPLLEDSCGNGELGQVYRALDLLPRDLVIADWHYFANEDLASAGAFAAAGHEVWGTVWFNFPGIRNFAGYAASHNLAGMISSTWCRPDVSALPLEPILYAAQGFQDPHALADPELPQRLKAAGQQLWRRWQKRQGK